MREKKVMKLASRGKRFGAFCIDAVVPVVATMIFFGAMIAIIVEELMYNPGLGYGFGSPGFGYGYGYGYSRVPSPGTVTALIIGMILSIAWLVVEMIFYNKSKTIGKAALGLQVVSVKDGEPIGFWKMLFREWFVKAASGSVFALGFIWILIDDKNRGWHDKILDTYVVDLKESEAFNAASHVRHERTPSPAPAPAAQAPTPKSAPLPVKEPAPQPAEEPSPETLEEYIEVDDNSAAVRNDVIEAAVSVVSAAQDAAQKATGDDAAEKSEEALVIELPGTVASPEEQTITTEENEEQ